MGYLYAECIEAEFVSSQKRPFYPNSSLLSKFYPRNIIYMPAVKFIERLDLKEKVSFLDEHELRAWSSNRIATVRLQYTQPSLQRPCGSITIWQ